MQSQSNPSPAVGLANFIGHKGRCFDIRYSPDGTLFVSASEDGTAKIWSASSKRCQTTLSHSKTSEVLRAEFLSSSVCCSGGSDGRLIVWSLSEDALVKHTKVHTIEHKSEDSQIYACESVGNNSPLLITAADSQLYLWDISPGGEPQCVNFWNFEAVVPNAGDHFGGPRNALNEVYVFDAKIAPSSSTTVAVALSDATIRMVDTRMAVEATVCATLSPGTQPRYPGLNFGHATSVNWSEDSNSLLVAMGSGKVALVDTRTGSIRTVLKGHSSAAYGACFVDNDRKCISWSSDSTIRAFNLISEEELKEFTNSYEAVAVKDTTIFSCCVAPDAQSLLCGGGTNRKETSFLGIPFQQLKAFW